MIAVTGATGKLGNLIVEHLLARMPADRIGVSVRDPGKAEAIIGAGVRVRCGDYAEPDGLAAAFEGASQLLVVSSNAAAHGGDPIAQYRAAIGDAASAGVLAAPEDGPVSWTTHADLAAAAAAILVHPALHHPSSAGKPTPACFG